MAGYKPPYMAGISLLTAVSMYPRRDSNMELTDFESDPLGGYPVMGKNLTGNCARIREVNQTLVP